MKKKGLSMPVTLIITIVVVIAVAMVVMALFGRSSTRFGESTSAVGDPATCASCIVSYCLQHPDNTYIQDITGPDDPCGDQCSGVTCGDVTCKEILHGTSPGCYK